MALHNAVRHYEADAIGHVNNAAYLHYLEQAAIEHSAAVGYPLGRYREMGTLFIVRRHEVEYLRPPSPGDVLEVVTWAEEIRDPRAVRAYEVYRHSQATSEGGTSRSPPTAYSRRLTCLSAWCWCEPGPSGCTSAWEAGVRWCASRAGSSVHAERDRAPSERFSGAARVEHRGSCRRRKSRGA